jgi:Skp family chaperone for outer membrane proteins
MKRVLMMLGLSGVLLAPLAAQEPSQEKPKTGIVNIQTLFRGYYKTLEAQAQINAERARIQKEDNEMLQRVKVLDQRLRDLTRRLQDATVGESDRKQISREVGLLFQERETVERSRQGGIQKRHEELNRKMIARMEGILDEIRGVIRENAEKEGYDYVFDVEGVNTAQVPFLLYAKDATDITSVIQKELRKTAPAE